MERLESDRIVKETTNKNFGFIFFIIFLSLSFIPYLKGKQINFILLVIGLFFGILAFFAPSILEKPKKLWLKLGVLLQKIVSPVVLAIIYFFVITPLAIWKNISNSEKSFSKLDKNKISYWKNRDQHLQNKKHFKMQF